MRAASANFAPPSPCAFCVPATSGMPLPMSVFAMMSCGLPLPAFFARSNAVEEELHVVAVDGLDVVAERLEALGGVEALRGLGHRVERDGVRVVDEDQVVELLVPGELHRLERDAFLHAPVAGEADDVMVEDRVVLRVEARLGHLRGDGHADRVRDALPERAGGRLDAVRRVLELGVTGRLRAELAEALHLVEGHLLVAAEVQPAVEEHRAMTGGEDEAIAIQPLGVRRVVPERVAEEHGADLGAAERQAEVAALARVNGVDREPSGDGGCAGEFFFGERAHRRAKLSRTSRPLQGR